MAKKIIGIDPGTKTTGWGIIIISGSRYKLVGCGIIQTSATAPLEKRYFHIFQELSTLIQIHTPDSLSIETQFMDKNFQSAVKIGMARATAYLAAAKHDIPVFEYAPTKAKQAVTGRGNADKTSVAYMVKLLLNLKDQTVPLDASDALALAITHAHYCK